MKNSLFIILSVDRMRDGSPNAFHTHKVPERQKRNVFVLLLLLLLMLSRVH